MEKIRQENRGLPFFIKKSRNKEGSSAHVVSQIMEGSIGCVKNATTGSIQHALAFQRTRSPMYLNANNVITEYVP